MSHQIESPNAYYAQSSVDHSKRYDSHLPLTKNLFYVYRPQNYNEKKHQVNCMSNGRGKLLLVADFQSAALASLNYAEMVENLRSLNPKSKITFNAAYFVWAGIVVNGYHFCSFDQKLSKIREANGKGAWDYWGPDEYQKYHQFDDDAEPVELAPSTPSSASRSSSSYYATPFPPSPDAADPPAITTPAIEWDDLRTYFSSPPHRPFGTQSASSVSGGPDWAAAPAHEVDEPLGTPIGPIMGDDTREMSMKVKVAQEDENGWFGDDEKDEEVVKLKTKTKTKKRKKKTTAEKREKRKRNLSDDPPHRLHLAPPSSPSPEAYGPSNPYFSTKEDFDAMKGRG